ncbi:hypothetical protein D9758_005495 [Tetrapyrgos nigripes]|uniref:NAD-dependent epimerase/dehydratase domain-containing protein n=1 Tax=Tetrapyrgos nigripes TaxID=182062 RepID=A0A8H5GIC5_9AGAR|nr:hypothetical protein D9758_005495 [Tetrapyrgos nigripes]
MSSSQKPLVFVTGASGLIGYAIVYHLLEAGYPVRGAARGKKLEHLKKALSTYPQFEAVEIADVSTGDYSEIFKGVEGLIHCAAVLPGRADKDTAFRSAVDGSLHVLEEAERAGIKKIVTTSSVSSFNYPVGPYGPDDFNPVTKEQAFAADDPIGFMVYAAEKKYADLAVLDWIKTRPHLNVTMLAPPNVYGVAPGFEEFLQKPGDIGPLTSNLFIYQLLQRDAAQFMAAAGFIDIRDLARAHILALDSIPQSAVSDRKVKRLAIAAPYGSDLEEAVKYISQERPELKERLIDFEKTKPILSMKLPEPSPWELKGIEYGRLEEILGMKKREFRTWKETVLDAVDRLVKMEERWKESS